MTSDCVLQLSRSSQRGLAQILRACGLEAELPSDDLGFGLGSVMAGRAPASLRAFLPAAAEAARQRQGAAMGPRHRLSIIRTALRLGRKVSHSDAISDLCQEFTRPRSPFQNCPLNQFSPPPPLPLFSGPAVPATQPS